MSQAPVRFGLMGYGAWGCRHALAIEETPGAELTAVVARSPTSCSAARSRHPGARVYGDYRELLACEDVEVVDVVLPSNLHHEVASRALSAGKHVLLEKPMGLSIAECDDLIQQAGRRGAILAVGHELRLSSLWGEVKRLVDQGAVGAPQYVLVELARRPYRHGADGWRFDAARVGDWILEEPIHFFDLARWYLSVAGEPESVYAAANSRQGDSSKLNDNFSAIVKYRGGPYAVISQTLSAFEHHQTVKVTGTKGALWASWSGAMDRTEHPAFSLRAFDGETVSDIPISKIPGELFELNDEIAMMVQAVRHGGPVAATGADGRWAVALCCAAARSVKSGRPVLVEEVLS